jgi:hypothetical protein
MASTFINQERWKDEFILLENRVWHNQQWILPYLQEVGEEKAQEILDKVRKREKQFNKDCTEWVLKNILNNKN